MDEPTLDEVIIEVLDSRLAQVHTALPGKVAKYYPDRQTADIKLQIKDVDISEDGSTVSRSYPVLPNVPILFPRAGGYFLTLPVAEGDFVFVVFCENAIDQWRAKGQETAPGDIRKHPLTGAVALPCLYPSSRALDTPDDEAIVIGKEGGSADFVALAGLVLSELQAIKTAYDTHTHTVPISGPAGTTTSTPPLVALPAPSPVAAEDVKAT